jgi:hypothetical protein
LKSNHEVEGGEIVEHQESHSSELTGNHLDDGGEGELAEFRKGAYQATLRKLRDDPELQRFFPELEKYIRGLVHAKKLKAPSGLEGAALDGEIADAVSRAIDDFRHKRHRRGDQGRAALNGARVESAADAGDGGAAEKPKPLPEICLRGTCEKWIATLEPRGEWPRPFLFAEWRMIHSLAIARGAGYGKGKLRYPHCHDLLIGESGITHKNTSIGRTESLTSELRKDICFLSNISSIEGVLETLVYERRSISLIAVPEYSYLVASGQRKGTSNILPVLNDAYDGVDPLTIVRKNAPVIRAPFVNLMSGCTPAWIRDYADKEGADLGRFNRCLVFHADQDRDIPNPDYLTAQELQEFARLFAGKMGEVLREPGAILFEQMAEEWFDQWFLDYRKRLRSLPDNLRKLMERDDDQVKIQALIYAVADGRRVASVDDFKPAAALVEWSRENKLRLFGEVELSADQRLERRILTWIARGGGAMTELYRFLGRDGTKEAIYRKLKPLVAMGEVMASRPLDQPSREPLYLYPPSKTAE